jgi:cystathionine beta-lyase
MNQPDNPVNLDHIIPRGDVPALKVHPRVLGTTDDSLFAAGVADMDFMAPPVVLEALQQRLNHGVFGYEAVPDELFPTLVQWLQTRHGWAVETDWILRAPNLLNAIAMATGLFSEPGDGIIIQPPVFFDFFDILKENHRTAMLNPLILEGGRYRMDFQDLERKAADPRAKMLYLCNPHNPVGRVWTKAELQRLGDICVRHQVLVVADEIHGDITYSNHPYTPFASLGPAYAQNAITCLSPAKSFNLAACCSAFTIIADEAKRARFQAENSRLTVNKNNAFASVAMVAAYQVGAPWLNQVLAYLERNLALVRERLQPVSGVTLIEPEGTFLLWLDFRALGLEPDDLMTFLRKRARWAVTRGHAFGAAGNGFARVNIACPRRRLEVALDRLVQAIDEL